MDKTSEIVYTPESALRHPKRLFREMFCDLWASRELAWRLFVRDISARYRQSILGYLWAFLPPLATTFAFILLNQSGILSIDVPSIPYPVYVMVGTVLWQLFFFFFLSPIRTVTAAKPMLAKTNFPREAIILSGVLEVLFNFLIRVVLLIVIFSFYRIMPPATVLLSLLGVFVILCLGFMIGVLLTPIGVLYTDVGQALPVVLSFWMLLTPVVYRSPSTGVLASLTKVNPVSPLIVTTREWMTAGTVSDVTVSCVIFAVTLALLFVGWLLYRLAMPILVERMGG